MKTIKLFLMAVIAGGLMACPLVYAQPAQNMDESQIDWKHERMERMHKRMDQRMDKVFDQLQLTEDQRKQLQANKESQRSKKKVQFEQFMSLRKDLKEELMKPDLDTAKVNSIHAQMKNLHAQMADERLNSVLEVRKILTPEQFMKFNTLRQENKLQWKSKMKEHKRWWADKQEAQDNVAK